MKSNRVVQFLMATGAALTVSSTPAFAADSGPQQPSNAVTTTQSSPGIDASEMRGRWHPPRGRGWCYWHPYAPRCRY